MAIKGCPVATLTWCSGKTLDRLAGRVFGSPSHGHPVDVSRGSCLTCLYNWPSWSLGNSCRVTGLLGVGRLPRCIDVDGACVRLRWLDGMVGLPGAGWQRLDNERDVDSGPRGIWQSSRTLWSRSYSLEKNKRWHQCRKCVRISSKTKSYRPYWKRPLWKPLQEGVCSCYFKDPGARASNILRRQSQ